MDEKLFSKGNRQTILDTMKGQESEKNLIALLPTDKLKKKFHENIESHVKGTQKEKTLSRVEMEQLIVRKLLELTNPNSEYDILLFQKVANSKRMEKSVLLLIHSFFLEIINGISF